MSSYPSKSSVNFCMFHLDLTGILAPNMLGYPFSFTNLAWIRSSLSTSSLSLSHVLAGLNSGVCIICDVLSVVLSHSPCPMYVISLVQLEGSPSISGASLLPPGVVTGVLIASLGSFSPQALWCLLAPWGVWGLFLC